jgi:uncharacterized protein (DUF362 family)/Pyruvate/2-oxoacid:ferredoxin oxidoreductase delta subunit
MSTVICKTARYEYENLRPLLFEMMEALDRDRIKSDSRVLIKPNLLLPAPPESGLLTHPLLVRAAVEYVIEKGAKPRVSDSPAMGSFQKVMKSSGIQAALDGLDVECKEFQSSVLVDIGEPFNAIEIAEDALNADIVINLAKLKTHSQMLLTLGVKNLFGCVVGLRKPRWHLKTGVDRELFASLLIQICRAVKPAITIIDGILALEGQGPGKGGIPRPVGVVIGSDDPVAADISVCKLLSVDPFELLTNKAARKLGMVHGPVNMTGDAVMVRDFKMPEITTLVFGPRWSHGLMRRHLIQRPVVGASGCRGCGECWRYCPAEAILFEGDRPIFDYDRCIRCFCCIEVCPQGALRAEEPLAGRIFSKIIRMRGRH